MASVGERWRQWRVRAALGLLAVVVVVLGVVVWSSNRPSTILQDPVSVGVFTDEPGVGFQDPVTGVRSGFDYDLLQYVVQQSATPGSPPPSPSIVEVRVDNREDALRRGAQRGGVNMVFASYTITANRELQVDFSRPYLSTRQGVLVRADDPRRVDNPTQLGGRTVCTERASVTPGELAEIPGVIVREENTLSECVRDLTGRNVDAVASDELLLYGYAYQSTKSGDAADRLRVEQNVNFGPIGEYAVGLTPQKGTANCELVSSYLDRFRASSEWRATLAKYFGPDFPAERFIPGDRPCVDDDDPGAPPP